MRLLKTSIQWSEAPTGTGKTLAYLTAAVYASLKEGRRVALSTAYRNLQDQLLGEIRDLQQHGAVAFRSQLLKGVGNYLCWSQVARYLDEGAVDNAQAAPNLSLAERFVLAYVSFGCLEAPMERRTSSVFG